MRPTQMGPCLRQKVCKPRNSGSGADDIKKVSVLARCPIGKFSRGTWTGGRSAQAHKKRPTGIVLQITHDPIGPFPPTGGKIGATDAFGIIRQSAENIIGLGCHGSATSACM